MYSKRAISKKVKRRCFVNVFLFILCLTIPYVAFGEEMQTIRGMHWGMKKAEVQAKEKWKLVGGEGRYLFYSGELKPGVKTNLTYAFYDGLLVEITYSLDKEKATYRYFRELLGEKYGPPYREQTEAQARALAAQTREIRSKGGVAHLGVELFQQLQEATKRLHAMWEIRGDGRKNRNAFIEKLKRAGLPEEKEAEEIGNYNDVPPQTHVTILYSPVVEVAIRYENYKYRSEKAQLEADKEQAAKYSLKNGGDL